MQIFLQGLAINVTASLLTQNSMWGIRNMNAEWWALVYIFKPRTGLFIKWQLWLSSFVLEQNTSISTHAGIRTQPSILASLVGGLNNDY